ncbi:universal stress protein, partial [Chloroflexota bacterium]
DIRQREQEHPEVFPDKVVSIDSVVQVGHAAEEIILYSNEENVSLIVMATHGRSGIKRLTLGRMADRVLRATRQPLVLIRAKSARDGIGNMSVLHKAIVALDGSEESEAVIPHIEKLTARLQTELILLQVVAHSYRVYADAEAYLETVLHLFKSKGINVNSVVRMGAAATEIINLANETKADIVAMSTHGRSGIRQWTIGSVADRILHRGNSHVLLVRSSQTRPD